MDVRQILEQLIVDFGERPLPKLTPRTVRLPAIPGKADVIVGSRRSGKTWYLFQQVSRLVEDGLPRDRILYLNFEDERLAPLSTEDLTLVVETYYSMYPEARSHEAWCLFDEIQNVAGWERFVRRILDTERVRIVLTGSSARLLTREIATSLRGRSISTEILPFSYAESLRHAGIEIPRRWPPPAATRSQLRHHFDLYMERGGYPEVQALDDRLRTRVLQEYVDAALFRDVVERHGVTNLTALRHLVRSLLRNPSGQFSVTRIHQAMKSQGIRIGKDALHEFLEYLEDAFLLFAVSRYTTSERQRMVNPRKCYLVDHALARAVSLPRPTDVGHYLENVVYLELRRREHAVSYHVTSGGHEVDFAAVGPDGAVELVQVCTSLAESDTRQREIRALDEAMSEFRSRSGTIVTLDEDTIHRTERGEIRIVPAWRWLLEG